MDVILLQLRRLQKRLAFVVRLPLTSCDMSAIKMLDDAGQAALLPKKKIATLVGRRQEDVSAVIDQARGKVIEEEPPKADPRFPESTRDGRPVSRALVR
jgi:hypothetical protein